MAKAKNIIKTVALKGDLSKEQKRFNSYLNKIKSLKTQIEDNQTSVLNFNKVVQEKVAPIETLFNQIWKKYLISLHTSEFVGQLTNKQKEKLGEILFHEADEYLADVEFDDEVKAIFDAYGEEDFDTVVEEQTEMGKDYIVNMFKNMYGIDISPDDIDDVTNPMNNPKLIEKLQEAEIKYRAEQEAEEQRRAEAKAKRKKTAKQIEKEEAQNAAQAAVSQTTKQIYLDLVKNFHPDTELDEAKKAWKTEIMQQVTVAYNEDNYIKLLELQMSLLEDRDNAIEKFDDKQLKFFNDALKQQVNELEMQLFMLSPFRNSNIQYKHLYSPNGYIQERNIDKHVKAVKEDISAFEVTLEEVKTLQGLKSHIKSYKFDNGGGDIDMNALLSMILR